MNDTINKAKMLECTDNLRMDQIHDGLVEKLKKYSPDFFEDEHDEIMFSEINDISEVCINMRERIMDTFFEVDKVEQLKRAIDIQDIDNNVLFNVLNTSYPDKKNIPSINQILAYVSETTEKNILLIHKRLMRRRIAVVVGPTGVAKTSMIKTLAYHLRLPLYQEGATEEKTFQAFTESVRIKTGKNKAAVTVPGKLIKAAQNGGIYLLDEANNLEGDVQLSIAQMIDDGCVLLPNGRRVKTNKNFFLVFTGNKNYLGTKKFSDAVLRRAGGEIGIGYLPLEEESDTATQLYFKRIMDIKSIRGLNYYPRIKEREILGVTELYKKIREDITSLSIETSRKGLDLTLMHDMVRFADVFSLKALVDILEMADTQDISNFSDLINMRFNFDLIKNDRGKQKIIAIVNKCVSTNLLIRFNHQIQSVRDDTEYLSKFEKCVDSPPGGDEILLSKKDLLDSIRSRKKQGSIFVKFNNNSDYTDNKGHFVFSNYIGSKKNNSLLENCSRLNRCDLSFEAKDEGTSNYPVIERNKLVEETYNILYDYSIEKNENPYIDRLKKIISFQVKDKKGFIVFGFRVNYRDVKYRSQATAKNYVLNSDRQKTIQYVFVEDQVGDTIINPNTGEIRFLDNSKINEYDGYIRCKLQEPLSSINLIIANKIRNIFVNTEVEDNDNYERIVTREIIPVSEGDDISEPQSLEDIGKYLKYPVETQKRIMDMIGNAHASRDSVLLYGPSGTAKSSIVKTYALHCGLRYIPVQFNERSRESNILKKLQLKDGEIIEVTLPLLMAYKYGWVAELKELNMAYPSDIAFLNVFLDKNSQVLCNDEIIKRHDDFLAVATINPFDPNLYLGTKPLNVSLGVTRFAKQIKVDYLDTDDEVYILMKTLQYENPVLWGCFEGYKDIKKKLIKVAPYIVSLPRFNSEQIGINDFREYVLNNILKILVKVSNIFRKGLLGKNLDSTFREFFQKYKVTTDILQDIVREPKDLLELVNDVYTKIVPQESEMTPEEKDVFDIIDQGTSIVSSVKTVLIDLDIYKKISLIMEGNE